VIVLPATDPGGGDVRSHDVDGSSDFAQSLFTSISLISRISASEQVILPTPTSPEWMMADKRRVIPRKNVPSSSSFSSSPPSSAGF
jgi:hypothetical protein